jgi:hypothetical protein
VIPTHASDPAPAGHASWAWRAWFRGQYRLLRVLHPLLRWWWRRSLPGLESIVDLQVPGRRSGRARRVLLTRLVVDGSWFVGHPNGEVGWTRNLGAAAAARLVEATGAEHEVVAVRLGAGPAREAAIRATWSQQPFPGNVIYTLARHHVRRVGVYFRLVPATDPVGRARDPHVDQNRAGGV